MTARVAAFVDQPSIVGSAPLYGRNMAVEMFFGALARHGQPGTYQLFYSHDDARTFIDNLSPAPGRLFEAAHVDDLFRDAGRFSFRAWHDPDADLASAARLRSALAMRMYPITATPHVLSYDGLLHGWILRMLLAGVQPCDAIICISRSAKTAIANLLAHVGDRLRAAHSGEFPFRGELVLLPLDRHGALSTAPARGSET